MLSGCFREGGFRTGDGTGDDTLPCLTQHRKLLLCCIMYPNSTQCLLIWPPLRVTHSSAQHEENKCFSFLFLLSAYEAQQSIQSQILLMIIKSLQLISSTAYLACIKNMMGFFCCHSQVSDLVLTGVLSALTPSQGCLCPRGWCGSAPLNKQKYDLI